MTLPQELDAAEVYFEKLKPDCLDTGASYAERQAQRKQEARTLPARFTACRSNREISLLLRLSFARAVQVADLQEALEMLEKV